MPDMFLNRKVGEKGGALVVVKVADLWPEWSAVKYMHNKSCEWCVPRRQPLQWQLLWVDRERGTGACNISFRWTCTTCLLWSFIWGPYLRFFIQKMSPHILQRLINKKEQGSCQKCIPIPPFDWLSKMARNSNLLMFIMILIFGGHIWGFSSKKWALIFYSICSLRKSKGRAKNVFLLLLFIGGQKWRENSNLVIHFLKLKKATKTTIVTTFFCKHLFLSYRESIVKYSIVCMQLC